MKASDIDTAQFLDAVERIGEEFRARNGLRPGGARWANIWALERAFPEFPPKVVLAKARQLLKRGYLNGCGCGCRGDFSVYTDYGHGDTKLERPPGATVAA